GRRHVAISASAALGAFSHAAQTRNHAALVEMTPPSPSKAARTILSTSNQVKIAWYRAKYIDLAGFIRKCSIGGPAAPTTPPPITFRIDLAPFCRGCWDAFETPATLNRHI